MGDLPEKHNLVIFIIRFKPHYLCNIRFIRVTLVQQWQELAQRLNSEKRLLQKHNNELLTLNSR